jgi:cytochrome c556
LTLNKTTVALGLFAGLSLAAVGAIAREYVGPPPTTPGPAAAYARQQNFKLQGAAFKAINDELKQDTPNIALIAANAAKLRSIAANLPSWFPRGSGPESGFPTDAKPEVWTDPAGFAAAATRLQVQTSTLQQLAAAGDLAGVRNQAHAVGEACKSCHDSYRVPDRR